MKVNDVVTVMTAAGEYVGKMLKMDETGIVLKDPKLVTANEQGMGFANGVAMTGVQDPTEMVILTPIFVTDTNPEVVKAWYSATSGLVIP